MACAHGIHCLNRQEVLVATQELRNKGPGIVGAELYFVPTVALCCHNVKLCGLAGIPGQRSHLKTSHRNVFISIYRKRKAISVEYDGMNLWKNCEEGYILTFIVQFRDDFKF